VNKRRAIGLAALLIVGAVILTIWAVLPRNVAYGGKKLSQWLEDFGTGEPDAEKRAGEAVRQMGGRAVPYLVQEIQAQESALRQVYILLAERQSWVHIPVVTAEMRRKRAIRAFEMLGPTAAPAIPALAALLKSDVLGHDAAHALSGIGGPAVPVLAAKLGDKNDTVRLNAVIAIGRFKEVPAAVVPGVVTASTERNLHVRCLAILALMRSGHWTASLLTPLTQCLADTNVPVRRLTAVLLGRLGADATSAVPALVRAIRQDPDGRVRTDVSNALMLIDPPALGGAWAR
jgi:HEAT repeat protein